MIRTNKFVMTNVAPGPDDVKLIDRRNNIECYGIEIGKDKVMDLYYSYISLLNGLKGKWKSYGYLDFGLIPVAMGPSFLHTPLKELVINRLSNLGIEYHLLPSISLMTGKYNNVILDMDVWVRRDLAAELMEVEESKVTVERFLRWCLE